MQKRGRVYCEEKEGGVPCLFHEGGKKRGIRLAEDKKEERYFHFLRKGKGKVY